MRRSALIVGLCAAAAATAAYACGGSEEPLFTGPGGSPDAGFDGTVDLDGGSDASPDQGPPVDAGPPCAPPKDPSKASMCLYFAPEQIQFDNNDPAFDGKGVIFIEVLATPNTDGGAVSALVVPTQPDGGVAQLDLSLPISPVNVDGLPSTVYVRASFVDDIASASSGLRAGWWLGGYDLTNGIVDAPIRAVQLSQGKGTNVTIDMVALRKLTVTVSRANLVAPAGNGQGPLSSIAISGDTLNAQVRAYGSATRRCGDVSGVSSAVLNGVVFGKGPYYLTGTLDDYGQGTSFPQGGMISVASVSDAGIKLPAANRITYAPNAYAVSHVITLNLALPVGDAGLDRVSCP